MSCRKEYQYKYRIENEAKLKQYRAQTKQTKKANDDKRVQDLKQHAIDSITSGEIIEQHKWDLWCNRIKKRALKYPYVEDFTNLIMFEMMTKRCFYCDDVATTIDRWDSTINHTQENCIASCWGCNNSKGGSDPLTFVKKAYFRARGEYMDDNTEIWHVNNIKPILYKYKKRADGKKVPFELTNRDFDTLIKGKCEYCKRSPTTWFGIDRVVPSLGYTVGNSVSCCWDCNRDKYEESVETMTKRNGRIAARVDASELIIDDCERVVLHNGTQKSSKKVCVYGQVYESKIEASRALGKGTNYVCNCIRNGSYPVEIFEIVDKSV